MIEIITYQLELALILAKRAIQTWCKEFPDVLIQVDPFHLR